MDVKQRAQIDFRRIADSAAIGMALLDESMNFVYVNPHMLNMLGYDLDELTEVSCPSISHPDDVKQIRHEFENLKQRKIGSMSVRKRFRCKSGDYLWTKYTLTSAGKMGDYPETYVGIIEKSGLASVPESGLRNVFQNIPDMVLVMDLDGNLIDFNPSFTNSAGYTHDEVAGRKFADFLTEESRATMRDVLASLEKGEERKKIEVKLRTKQDSILYLQVTSIPQYENGSLVSAWYIARDITQNSRRALELNRINKQVIEKNRELEQIVYVTSHDLRSPLVNIQGFTQELEISLQDLKKLLKSMSIPEKYANELEYIVDTEIPESVDYINSGIYKMDRLLKGLLSISRLGRRPLEKVELNMNSLVGEIIKSNEYQLKEAGIKLHVDKLPPCKADEAQIIQVLSNLMDNSIKYMRPEVNGEITISGEKTHSGVMYTVTDNGKGIPEDKHERVFEIFYRDEQKESGEGLGLTIVRKVIDKHLGDVSIHSGKEHGTVVSFTIPS